ncbi:hypothetical protein ACQJBY_032487 [Aegilops geniculata]
MLQPYNCILDLCPHRVIHNNYFFMMDDMFLYHASNFFERCLSCANSHMHIHIMMDDVYIYHAQTFFRLCLFCVGTHEYSSTSQSHEFTKRALESNDDSGSHGVSFPPLPSRKDSVHLFYMALTWLWVIVHYIFYAHLAMFTLHDMLIPMPFPCTCDPCFALHMMIDSSTCMCICKLGGDSACYCHVPFANHSYDDTMILPCVRACDMPCALSMPTICTHDMIDLLASHMLNNCSLLYVECHDIFTTLYAHYAWIVLHLPHVFTHLIILGVLNDSYAYHRPFVEHVAHSCYDLEVDSCSLLTHISILTSHLHACFYDDLDCAQLTCLNAMPHFFVKPYVMLDDNTCWVSHLLNAWFCSYANHIFFQVLGIFAPFEGIQDGATSESAHLELQDDECLVIVHYYTTTSSLSHGDLDFDSRSDLSQGGGDDAEHPMDITMSRVQLTSDMCHIYFIHTKVNHLLYMCPPVPFEDGILLDPSRVHT